MAHHGGEAHFGGGGEHHGGGEAHFGGGGEAHFGGGGEAHFGGGGEHHGGVPGGFGGEARFGGGEPHFGGGPNFVRPGVNIGVNVGVVGGVGFHAGFREGIIHNEFPGYGGPRVFRRCYVQPGYGLIRREMLVRAIARRAIINLAYATALTEVMIVYDPMIGTFRCASDLDPPPCMGNHAIVQLPEYVELTFRDPYNPMMARIYYADSYCSLCGQYFFIEPMGGPMGPGPMGPMGISPMGPVVVAPGMAPVVTYPNQVVTQPVDTCYCTIL